MQIDKFGKFPYVLVKLSDRMAGNKLIVRGKNGRSEPQLVSAVSKEVEHWLQALQMSGSAETVCNSVHALDVHWPKIQHWQGCMVERIPVMPYSGLLHMIIVNNL